MGLRWRGGRETTAATTAAAKRQQQRRQQQSIMGAEATSPTSEPTQGAKKKIRATSRVHRNQQRGRAKAAARAAAGGGGEEGAKAMPEVAPFSLGLDLSKGSADSTFQCNKKTSSENCTSILRSVTRDLARALSPHSRGCWSNVHDPRPFIPVPLAACGKAHLECRLTGEAH